jgi:hypothetical protein
MCTTWRYASPIERDRAMARPVLTAATLIGTVQKAR